ncbi:hypothetical protein AC478_01320 [miscellaneous Crenarchaeota group-1 archaeon SG8-32-3]|uniref:Right handed beta helix domain-containing protein n=1 Tax=miscellaneous Crenarchaeota group-1 archaeon SG8-32-3 TaxID=1685125 RepID=A0A0M0BTZ7_9ARCH|nr:MAG: hypothetical protein AC478_01320 [miscellaneous Crenarchaeota group-1 archaeon SG8-32-3]
MKITLSKRAFAVILVIALALTAVNTYLIFDLRRALEDAANDSQYDYMIFQDGNTYKAKNQKSGFVDFTSADAALVLNQAIVEGNTIYIKAGNYTLISDIQVYNKKNTKILSDGAAIIGNGKKLIIKGDSYATSQDNSVSGLKIINGTLRIENSFGTKVSSMAFVNSSTALELANTETWSEGTKIEDCRFENSRESIVFRAPTGNSTGSYASSQISRCFFNIHDDSVGITVEYLAEFSDSQLQNVRMWMGENGMRNQTGLLVNGSMHQTLLSGVVFESFADYPDQLYAISLGETSITPPILGGDISFLGNWTAKIHNPFSKWISGLNAVFKHENLDIQIGLNGEYGVTQEFQLRPDTILSFKPKIQVQGSFAANETVKVRFRLEFIDNIISRNVEKSFTNSTTLWLSDDDILRMFPSQSIIWAILIDATVNSASTDAVVQVSLYGVTT